MAMRAKIITIIKLSDILNNGYLVHLHVYHVHGKNHTILRESLVEGAVDRYTLRCGKMLLKCVLEKYAPIHRTELTCKI
jgi:hypothetical protein